MNNTKTKQSTQNKWNKKLILTLFLMIGFLLGIFINHNFLNTKKEKLQNQKVSKLEAIIITQNRITKKLQKKLKEKETFIVKLKKTGAKDVYVTLNKSDLIKDLERYKFLSSKNKKIIIKSIIEASKKYSINPAILYSLISVESSFKFWIEHPSRYVIIDKKKIKVKAVGLGGVIYEWWGKDLVKEGIIETRSDLFDIRNNILSVAYIYNNLRKMPLKKKAKNAEYSAMLRYFGGSYLSYVRKIDDKIISILRRKLYG